MLTGGKLGETCCHNCGMSLGALITCHHCGYINNRVDSVDTSTEHVEKTAESIHVNKLHRYAGRFCND